MTEKADIPFWKRKTLTEMTRDEWESLCDGCGKCCLLKLEDWDTAEIHTPLSRVVVWIPKPASANFMIGAKKKYPIASFCARQWCRAFRGCPAPARID
jgi:hypothetical protein